MQNVTLCPHFLSPSETLFNWRGGTRLVGKILAPRCLKLATKASGTQRKYTPVTLQEIRIPEQVVEWRDECRERFHLLSPFTHGEKTGTKTMSICMPHGFIFTFSSILRMEPSINRINICHLCMFHFCRFDLSVNARLWFCWLILKLCVHRVEKLREIFLRFVPFDGLHSSRCFVHKK